MQTIYGDTWSDISQSYDIGVVCHEVKVIMTYISWSSDFALYLEDYLMDEHQTF